MHTKRKVQDVPIILDETFFPDLLQTVEKTRWPYKTNTAILQQRDQALISFLILTGVRARETKLIQKKQIRNYQDHILIVNIKTVKHGDTRDKVILPKTGNLAPFTEKFETWLNTVPTSEAILFPTCTVQGTLNWSTPLSTRRIHEIIHQTNGLFTHWFRGCHETIYGKAIFENDPYALKKHMGLKNLDSVTPYVTSNVEKYTKNIYKV